MNPDASEVHASDGSNGASRTSRLLQDLSSSGPGDAVALGEIVDAFRSRSFGVLLMLVLLPAFIPLPIGTGSISGPLVSILGLEMLLTLRTPWLPQRTRRRTIQRQTLTRLAARIGPMLARLERLSRPRLQELTRSTGAHAFTGAQLVVLGILLALPIPLTNYPFALLILGYAIAIIERDGALLLLAWVMGCITIATWAVLSGGAIELAAQWLAGRGG